MRIIVSNDQQFPSTVFVSRNALQCIGELGCWAAVARHGTEQLVHPMGADRQGK
jgi:hypothetical protein